MLGLGGPKQCPRPDLTHSYLGRVSIEQSIKVFIDCATSGCFTGAVVNSGTRNRNEGSVAERLINEAPNCTLKPKEIRVAHTQIAFS